MKKRILALVLIVSVVLQTAAFAYRWEEKNGDWYVLNTNKNEYLKGTLLDVGDNVYYLDTEGKLVTGWWQNLKTQKYYFFDNKKDRNLGGMIFGLHMIDGYYYYFGSDGSLQTSSEKGELRKVFQDYYADYDGYLYKDDKLQRDTSIMRSEYYTDAGYYENILLNNYFLANHDTNAKIKKSEIAKKSNINTDSATTGTKKTSDPHKTSGGTNYEVDDMGRIVVYGDEFETRPQEKYGPMVQH